MPKYALVLNGRGPLKIEVPDLEDSHLRKKVPLIGILTEDLTFWRITLPRGDIVYLPKADKKYPLREISELTYRKLVNRFYPNVDQPSQP